MSVIFSSADLKKYWDAFSDNYDLLFAENTSLIFRHLLPILKLSAATCIVEAGCGPGRGLQILRETVPVNVKILANDISSEMVSKAISKNIANAEIIESGNETLPYPDEVCDRYIASLSLMLVTDPVLMLNEAFRLLKPGGLAAFSVWGHDLETNVFSILNHSMKIGAIVSARRSNFHLNNSDELCSMLRQAGFVDVRYSYIGIPIELTEAVDIAKYSRSNQALADLRNSNEEKFEEIIRYCVEETARVLESGKIITFESLIVVGKKPN
jgi:ubiquinone/menaquinone biosynthesis C-methylase UbiE